MANVLEVMDAAFLAVYVIEMLLKMHVYHLDVSQLHRTQAYVSVLSRQLGSTRFCHRLFLIRRHLDQSRRHSKTNEFNI